MTSVAPLQNRISSNMGNLSPRLQLAAEYTAKHPQEVASRSLRYVAKAANLTPPTFSRLAKALGYADYEQFRDACRVHTQLEQRSFAEKAQALQSYSGNSSRRGSFVVSLGTAAMDNLRSLMENVDIKMLEAVSVILAKARKVHLVGYLSSRPFVDYMAYMASMAFDSWEVLSQKGKPLAAAFEDISQRDVLLVVAMAPHAAESIRIAELAHEQGITIVGISDSLHSPLLQFSDYSLLVETDSPQFFPSHVSMILLMEAMVGMVVGRSGEATRKRIASIEATSYQLGEYWPVSKNDNNHQRRG